MTLKLEVGKTYVDAQGRKVKIIHKSSGEKYPYWGAVNNGATSEYMVQYTQDGCSGGSFNLLKEYVGPNYRWFNLYTCRVGNYFRSLEDALAGRANDLKLVSMYQIDLNTGDITKVED